MTPLSEAQIGPRFCAGAALTLFKNPSRILIGQVSETDAILVDPNDLQRIILVGQSEKMVNLMTRQVLTFSADGGIDRPVTFHASRCPNPACTQFALPRQNGSHSEPDGAWCLTCGTRFVRNA